MKREKNQPENHASSLPKHKKRQLGLGGYTTQSGILKLQYRSNVSYTVARYANRVARYRNRVARYRNRVVRDEEETASSLCWALARS